MKNLKTDYLFKSGCPAKIWKEMWECGKGLGNVGFSPKM
jgi:hypothetical protein